MYLALDYGIAGTPGEWIYYPDNARRKAFEAIYDQAIGELPGADPGLVIRHDDASSVILPLDGGGSGDWSLPCTIQEDLLVGTGFESGMFQNEDGVTLVTTVGKALHLSLISTEGGVQHVLGLRLSLAISVDGSSGESGIDEVDLYFPIESFEEQSIGSSQFDGLANLIIGDTEGDEHRGYTGPVLEEKTPPVMKLNCRTATMPAAVCYCGCWRTWRNNMQAADDQLAACLIGLLGIQVLGQFGCGLVCLATLPTGGALAPACVACLTWLYGSTAHGAAACLALYGVYRLMQLNNRRNCLAGCGGGILTNTPVFAPPPMPPLRPVAY